MGMPSQVKTDNGPAYVSKAFETFYAQWHIVHTIGIPYNPQGQAIIKRTHQTLKLQVKRLQRARKYFVPHHLLSHTLFVLNHLNTNDKGLTPAMVHWTCEFNSVLPKVLRKDLLSGQWKGPDVLITSGRGYAYVFSQDANSPIWIPDGLVQPMPGEAVKKEEATETDEISDVSNEENESNSITGSGNHLDENQTPCQGS